MTRIVAAIARNPLSIKLKWAVSAILLGLCSAGQAAARAVKHRVAAARSGNNTTAPLPCDQAPASPFAKNGPAAVAGVATDKIAISRP